MEVNLFSVRIQDCSEHLQSFKILYTLLVEELIFTNTFITQ